MGKVSDHHIDRHARADSRPPPVRAGARWGPQAPCVAREESTSIADRDLIERHLERVIAKPLALELCLLPPWGVSGPGEETNTCVPSSETHGFRHASQRRDCGAARGTRPQQPAKPSR